MTMSISREEVTLSWRMPALAWAAQSLWSDVVPVVLPDMQPGRRDERGRQRMRVCLIQPDFSSGRSPP